MTGTRDAADLTNRLVDWVRSVRPDAKVRVASSRDEAEVKPASDKDIAVRLVRVECETGPRSGEAVSGKLQLEYEFRVAFVDPVAEHQAIADLAFAMLEHDDLGERGEVIRGENSALAATFVLRRQRDLPRAKPVRETVFHLRPQTRVAGFVRAQNGFPIARARLRVHDSNRLIVTGNDGGFAFAAPDGVTVRATVSAKGKTADVELKPGDPNLITLAMEL
jgi:translation initiation factor IF-1